MNLLTAFASFFKGNLPQNSSPISLEHHFQMMLPGTEKISPEIVEVELDSQFRNFRTKVAAHPTFYFLEVYVVPRVSFDVVVTHFENFLSLTGQQKTELSHQGHYLTHQEKYAKPSILSSFHFVLARDKTEMVHHLAYHQDSEILILMSQDWNA